MGGTWSTFRLFISDELLDLAIDAIRDCSLATRRFEGLRSTVATSAHQLLSTGTDPEAVVTFLSKFPIDGPRGVDLAVSHKDREAFKAAGDLLAEATGLDLTTKQRFAILVLHQIGNPVDSRGC